MAVEEKRDEVIASKLKVQDSENGENGSNDDKDHINSNNNSESSTNNQVDDASTPLPPSTDDPAAEKDPLDEDEDEDDEDEGDEGDGEVEGEIEKEITEGTEALELNEGSYVKHPLQHGWTIWYDNPGKRSSQANWADQLKKITTVTTVEDFWRVFNNLKPASSLPAGSNYHIFKEHIEPKWEDPVNSKGGKWTVSVPSKNRSSTIDQMWLWTILACIGETIRSPDDVCGLVVSIRKSGDRVQIWTRDASNEFACREIGRSLKETLEVPDNVLIGYLSHADSMKKSSRNRYEV